MWLSLISDVVDSSTLPLRLAAPMALRLLLVVAVSALALDMAAALGVNYGQVADNLPSPQDAAVLLRALKATKVKLYDADARVLSAFAGSGVDFTVGLPDNLVPRLASNPSAAAAWVRANIIPHLPATSITAVTVGNEVLTGTDTTMRRSLLPAMESLHAALAACNITSRIAVTTAHSLAVLSSSFPPSSAAFRHDLLPYITPLLAFLAKTNSPFLINAYPYFAYKADPGSVDLDYVLFESHAGVLDAGTGLRYGNMLHAQVDAVRTAICAADYGRAVEIQVSETGWPSQGDGDEAGASPQNAARYNGNLMRLVAQGKGTPGAPGEPLQVYVFALFNENQKPGPASERHYGLFKPDGTPAYDVGVKAPTIGARKGSGNGNGDGNNNSTGGGAGLIVGEGPGETGGVGPGTGMTGYYTISSATLKAKRWRCTGRSTPLMAILFLMVYGLCWS